MNEYKYVIKIEMKHVIEDKPLLTSSLENGGYIWNSLHVLNQEVFEGTDNKKIEFLKYFPASNDIVHFCSFFLPFFTVHCHLSFLLITVPDILTSPFLYIQFIFSFIIHHLSVNIPVLLQNKIILFETTIK